MKRMLFNATQQEELRVAIVDGQKLIDIDIETAGKEQRKGNIYNGIITRIEPSLEACFVNYGEDRHGFLPFKEVSRQYFTEGIDMRSARIQDVLREGQELIIQVEKEERVNKGAALTTFISLAGRYLVLMPNNPRGGGVSRRVEGEDRQELRELMTRLQVPEGMNIIARTAGIGRSVEELQWDLTYLLQLWRAIKVAAKNGHTCEPMLIYLESSLVIRAIRDYFQPDIAEILIDTTEIYNQARAFMDIVMPDKVSKVKRYQDDVPLFSRFQIEQQIETAYSGTVPLLSGGAIAVDHTEALVAIDVNSARATKGADIEETAIRTNLEAADEVARQLRLRDLGGLIVIDFIDMESSKSQREVEQRLKDALKYDRARVQMSKISRFGLMELSRQRLRPALSEGSHITCPRCIGTGYIRDTESSALQVLRIIQEEAIKENTSMIHCQVPVDVATFLLNEKRQEINKIESRFKVSIILIPNKNIETPHYKIERLRQDDVRLNDQCASWKIIEETTSEIDPEVHYSKRNTDIKRKKEAVIKGITPERPAPSHVLKDTSETVGVLAPLTGNTDSSIRLISWIKNIFGMRQVSSGITQKQKEQSTDLIRETTKNIEHRTNRNRNRRGNIQRQSTRESTSMLNDRQQTYRKERKGKGLREPFEHSKDLNMTTSLEKGIEHLEKKKQIHQPETHEVINRGKLDIETTRKNNIDTCQYENTKAISRVSIYEDDDRRRRRVRHSSINNRERDKESKSTKENRSTITKMEVIASNSSIEETGTFGSEILDTHTDIANIREIDTRKVKKSVYREIPICTETNYTSISDSEVTIQNKNQTATYEKRTKELMLISKPKIEKEMSRAIINSASISSLDADDTKSVYIKKVVQDDTVIVTEKISVDKSQKYHTRNEPTSQSSSIQLSVTLEKAGLVWSDTDPDKLRYAQDANDRLQKPARIPRERKMKIMQQQTNDESPMQQVETTCR